MKAQPTIYLVVNVDSDPDPVGVHQTDDSLLTKYRRLRDILADYANGKAAWSVLTGPICRDRFHEPPFVAFWRGLYESGADLVLHAEEDLYGPPPGKTAGSCSYYDTHHMRQVILGKSGTMRDLDMPFAAYRGGYHGFTPDIGVLLKETGIGIDLSCAPGVVWPEKAAAWDGAPLSAFYMSSSRPAGISGDDEKNALFEIPWAWDAREAGASRKHRFVVGENYMINEFSTLAAMQAVWDAVGGRACGTGVPQIVSMICHTFTMGQPEYEGRLTGILDYVAEHGAEFVTPREAKGIYDAFHIADRTSVDVIKMPMTKPTGGA
jgi:hypothetical protein